MAEDWTRDEVEAIVADYFSMWTKELQGLDFNKAEHNRHLRSLISGRSRGSIEKKHQNISAVLWHLDFPYIDGYKPLPNYQTLLGQVVEERLSSEPLLNQLVARQVRAQVEYVPPVENLTDVEVPPPSRREVTALLEDEARRKTTFVRRNYLEVEANNHSLGLAGEEFIVKIEQERLRRAGHLDLANRVEHVSQTQGDYLGFDIASFDEDGHDRLIEVKTTRYGAMTRFFASSNEVDVSHKRKDDYRLFRLYHFDKQPKFFVLAGSLRDTCQLKAVSYSGVPL